MYIEVYFNITMWCLKVGHNGFGSTLCCLFLFVNPHNSIPIRYAYPTVKQGQIKFEICMLLYQD